MTTLGHPGWVDIKRTAAAFEAGGFDRRAPCDLHVYAGRAQIIVPHPLVPPLAKGSTQ